MKMNLKITYNNSRTSWMTQLIIIIIITRLRKRKPPAKKKKKANHPSSNSSLHSMLPYFRDLALKTIKWNSLQLCHCLLRKCQCSSFIHFYGPLLSFSLIENILSKTIISEIKGISKTHVLKKNNEFFIQTEGINYQACYNCSKIEHNSLYSNDISLVHQLYGIEAARNCLISEISMVFNVYHISLDPRHFSLIADYMTQQGSIRPLNRIGIASAASPFLKMSFETTMQFLTHAALYREKEENQSLSSAIVLGSVPKVGTGMFDLRHRIK